MNYKKLKAFTLAEVLVVILVLSILLAAYAPIFTKRYSDGARDEVWTYVSADDNSDAYYDVTNKTFSAQAFIGLTPPNKNSVVNFSKNASNQPIYSKLIIAASKDARINALTRKIQNQIQFRYGNDSDAGDLVGSLFAGNGNMLLGGPYSKITLSATDNTAYGSQALTNITSGKGNTGIGYGALMKLTTGYANTSVGANSGENTTSGIGNTFIGTKAGQSSTSSYNTFIGYRAGYNVTNTYNTAIGYKSMENGGGIYNTAIGTYSLDQLGSNSSNKGNTAIGYYALHNLESGQYNTAVGANSCQLMQNTSYKTCIGATSGSAPLNSPSTASNVNSIPSNLYTDSVERVYLGALPIDTIDNKPMAVLEVHNVSGKRTSTLPVANAGNPSVVINGNLIVRGQSYLSTPIYRPRHLLSSTQYNNTYKGLVAFKLMQANNDSSPKDQKGFAGYDGAYRTGRSYRGCHGCKQHAADDLRPNCICTVLSGSNSGTTKTSYLPSTNYPLSTSYDWSSKTTGTTGDGCDGDDFGASYTDGSFSTNVSLIRNDKDGDPKGADFESDRPLAHLKSTASCCPVLKSDRRLKNVKQAYTGGLSELKKLNIYNYTFKNDENKIPQVGVIAQDLKLVFPNAVTKGEDGYLKIRWDEMLYATVNSIKTLYSKVENLVAKIKTDSQRISNLKKDNEELNDRLDKLADELTKLEAKKN